jgi:hypothetical protein
LCACRSFPPASSARTPAACCPWLRAPRGLHAASSAWPRNAKSSWSPLKGCSVRCAPCVEPVVGSGARCQPLVCPALAALGRSVQAQRSAPGWQGPRQSACMVGHTLWALRCALAAHVVCVQAHRRGAHVVPLPRRAPACQGKATRLRPPRLEAKRQLVCGARHWKKGQAPPGLGVGLPCLG